jgi:putrescine transport system permease protein
MASTTDNDALENPSLPTRLSRAIQARWKLIVLLVPFIWMLVFFLFPFFIVAKISIAEAVIASPPFSKMVEWTDDGALTLRLVFDNFVFILEDDLYMNTYVNSVKIAGISTVICLLIGYQIAYCIVRSPPLT